MAIAVKKDFHDHNEEGLNFSLEQNIEKITLSFWLIMLLQIFWTIAIDSISHNKIQHCFLFIDTCYIFLSMNKDEDLSK